jgi:hypothetical protein
LVTAETSFGLHALISGDGAALPLSLPVHEMYGLINLVFTPGQGLQLFLVAELKFDAFTWLA